jgi:hypothetical protein
MQVAVGVDQRVLQRVLGIRERRRPGEEKAEQAVTVAIDEFRESRNGTVPRLLDQFVFTGSYLEVPREPRSSANTRLIGRCRSPLRE